jgi:hypothetical protein
MRRVLDAQHTFTQNAKNTMNREIQALRTHLRERREELKLSREALADAASTHSSQAITRRQIEMLEVNYQRLPPPTLLNPVLTALGLDRKEVLEIAGYL